MLLEGVKRGLVGCHDFPVVGVLVGFVDGGGEWVFAVV